MFIFPRARMKSGLLQGAPDGSTAECQLSGEMHKTAFINWMLHFVDHAEPTGSNPVLLVLDGHSTETNNLEVLDSAKKNHIFLVSFIPHCPYRMRPLHAGLMESVSTCYNQVMNTWKDQNPRKTFFMGNQHLEKLMLKLQQSKILLLLLKSQGFFYST